MASYHAIKDRWTTRAGEWLGFAAAWSFMWVTRGFSLWTLTDSFAPVGGFLARVVPGARARVMENLEHVWPELDTHEKRRILTETGADFMRLMIEYAHFAKMSTDVALEVAGIEHLEAARDAGKGAILVTAHFGNWEAIRLAAKRAGCESGIIYRAFNNRYLDRYTMNLIQGLGTPVVQKGRPGMRRLVTHVARGGIMMIIVDQRNTGAPMLPFVGKPAETVTAAAELAERTGAALIPAVAFRRPEARRFDVRFEPPVTGTDPQAMMTEVNRRISAWIEESPEQWFWFHRRWKTKTSPAEVE